MSSVKSSKNILSFDSESKLNIEINVCDTEKRRPNTTLLNLREFYTVYLIETRFLNDIDSAVGGEPNKLSSVWRRYTDFEHLRSYLEQTYSWCVVPPLPEKHVMYNWQKITTDTADADFVDRRRAGLENFLLRVAGHPSLCCDQNFLEFLQKPEWKLNNNHFGILEMAESKLKSLNVTHRLHDTDSQIESIKRYASELETNLNQVLKSRANLADFRYNLHKLHANYGRVFSEWSVFEPAITGTELIGDCLQKSGHFLDTYASWIDTILDDEELIADQLKEYLFFTNSLLTVCKNYEQLQFNLEQIDTQIKSKSLERFKLENNSNHSQHTPSSIMSRLFGTSETSSETHAQRLEDLDQKIKNTTEMRKEAKHQLECFREKALEDIQLFEKQKNQDLQETLLNYSKLQFKSAKKNLQIWQQIYDCISSIP